MFPNEVIVKSDSVISETYYHIRPKDNLYKVSKAYNIPIWQLAEWNNIDDISRLKVGDSLKILLYGYENVDLNWGKRTPNEELNDAAKAKHLPAYKTIDSLGVQKWNAIVDYINNSNKTNKK